MRFPVVAVLTILLAMLSGCSGRPAPAPVVEVYQGKNYQDFERSAFSGDTYRVQEGDTLFSIAWYTGQEYRDLARINDIAPPYNIYPGQELKVTVAVNKPAKKPGQTRRKFNQDAVDPPAKQAYGDRKNVVNNHAVSTGINTFPARVSNWMWPATGKLISGFSTQEQGNKGVDIAGTRGSAILAAADGKVVYTGDALRGYGKLIIVKHTESFLSAYAHNDSILVKEQDWITAGQKIASMGNSGTDTVKLHFEVRYKGKSVDPLRYLPRQKQQ